MLQTILIVAGSVLILYLIGRLTKSIHDHKKTQGELDLRLTQLEDRFYHPTNYDNAFFRPMGKKTEK